MTYPDKMAFIQTSNKHNWLELNLCLLNLWKGKQTSSFATKIYVILWKWNCFCWQRSTVLTYQRSFCGSTAISGMLNFTVLTWWSPRVCSGLFKVGHLYALLEDIGRSVSLSVSVCSHRELLIKGVCSNTDFCQYAQAIIWSHVSGSRWGPAGSRRLWQADFWYKKIIKA